MAPKPDEPLLLYVVAMTQVVSVMLVAEREEGLGTEGGCPVFGGYPVQPTEEYPGNVLPGIPVKRCLMQCPVYFISAVLQDAQERYPEIQKSLLGVLIMSRKLKHYFEVHRVMVVTSFPLERALRNHSTIGLIAK